MKYLFYTFILGCGLMIMTGTNVFAKSSTEALEEKLQRSNSIDTRMLVWILENRGKPYSLIDVRRAKEYKEKHIKTAISKPIG